MPSDTSSRLDLLEMFRSAAYDANAHQDKLVRQAAHHIRRIKSRNDAEDVEVWDELQERLAEREFDVDWMNDYEPDDDLRSGLRHL